jgi:hypothetical protein
VLALFPIFVIKELKMDLKLKIGLSSVMGLGIIATIAATIKTVQLKNLSTPDFTYNAIDLIYRYMTENWVIVIAASIPTLGPLYFIVTGQRTAESFAAPGRNSGLSGKRSGLRRTLGWKLRSSLFRSTEASGSTEGSKYSRMEKGLAGSQTSNYPALFANRDMTEGASRSPDTELMPVMVGGSR